jgi:hypothetical protein
MYRPDWDQMDLGVPIPELLFNEDLIGNDALAVDLEEHLGNAHYVQEDDIKREKIDNFFSSFFAGDSQLKGMKEMELILINELFETFLYLQMSTSFLSRATTSTTFP